MIVTVEVEDQPTGSVSLSGGYSTTAGFLAEVAFTETNFLGRGQYVKVSASEGQYSRGWGASFTEPYFLDQRLAAGFDVYHKEQNPNTWATYYNLDDRRQPAPRRADHQRIHVPADLFDLSVADPNSEHDVAALRATATTMAVANGSALATPLGHFVDWRSRRPRRATA